MLLPLLAFMMACNDDNSERIYPKLEPPGSVLSYVFQQGGDGYSCFRIPAIVMTKSGTLLAFAEGRKNGCGDEDDIDLVLKRSLDTGKTWSKLSVVWSDAENTCGNPVPIVDRNTGKIVLLMTWNRGDDAIGTINAGTSKDTRRVYLTSSSNDGVSWEPVKEITSSVKKAGWGWYATGPCHGIQTAAGRMIAPCDYIEVGAGRRGNSHVIYSDDAGVTWQLGGIVPTVEGVNPNESTVAELSGGKLLLNMRVGNNENLRMSSTSTDGGITWSTPYNEPQLIDPVCQGSLLSATIGGSLQLFFSNPAATTRRTMTIKLSTDEGAKWDKKNIVFDGPAGYSDLVQLSGTHIGLLYEAGVAKYTNGIAFKSVAIANIK
ncbi:glycoside hydrolase [Chitinophaga horti]|uniref:exo-alpha-sialidase n=1 Tax=Chitinophaga horti TaxID=2920382 RepID=A0ABY6J6X2_9BACT|nr:sialidase family protein [Chitinophaga horti]UYQ95421.1 glycoside hydrolase [Chitinophaga horti]